MVVILMGPTGAGKSTVGTALAASLGWVFVDGDGGPPRSVAAASALSGADSAVEARIRELHALAARALDRREHLIIACSALTAHERERLRGALQPVRFVYLKATRQVLESRRVAARSGPAVPVLYQELLTLEDPGDAAVPVDASHDVVTLVGAIRRELGL